MKSWTCVRVTDGVKCGFRNPSKKTMICAACGKRRPPSKRPAHMAALDAMDYEQMAAEFGEVCGVCGAPPPPGKRLYRDHDHRSGMPRGLACFRCNAAMRPYMTLEWMRWAVAYLERAERRYGDESEAA